MTADQAERLAEALKLIRDCGQSIEPDHWKFRVWARDLAEKALRSSKPAAQDRYGFRCGRCGGTTWSDDPISMCVLCLP